MILFAQLTSLAIFLGMWAHIGYHDWLKQRIPHRSLLVGLATASSLYCILGVMTLLRTQTHFHAVFYYNVGGHVLVSTVGALFLWYARIWPAGDAKLFAILALLFPLLPGFSGANYGRLFLVVLINVFLPAAAALFVRAAWYIFDTRLRHLLRFAAGLDWKADLALIRETAGALLKENEAWKEKVTAGVKYLIPEMGRWLVSMASMAVVSYFIQSAVPSPFLLSLICMAGFYLWGRLRSEVGETLGWALPLAVAAALLSRQPQIDWARLFGLFGSISVFGFFMFLGTTWAIRLLSGGAGAVAFLLPFAIPLVMFAITYLLNMFAYAIRWLFNMAGSAIWGVKSSLPGSPLLSLTPPAFLSPYFGTIIILGVFGLFAGLSLVLVRIWDEEVRPKHAARDLAAYLVLAPAFLDRLKEDEDFYEEHFSSTYPDGLTHDQALALRQWCADNGVEHVPLAPTLSFASWLFLGYMATLLTGGRHVLEFLQ